MTYTGRPRINMSSFMDTLNLVPDNEISDITFPAFENDLFLQGEGNAWFDFDQGTTADLQAAPFDFDANNNTTTLDTEATNLLGADFDFQGFDGLAPQPQVPFQNPMPYQATPSNFSSPPTSLAAGPQPGDKRKASEAVDPAQPVVYENEASQLAAEEDKRRRNTAASARFRVKKKQREQALEKSAKEMQDKMLALENKINQLETENKWLKSLVVEKKDSKSAEEVAEMYKKFKEESESKEIKLKDGVGTVAIRSAN